MSVGGWLAFVLAVVVALAVPGPDLILVVQAAGRGLRSGVSVAAGIVAGLALHASLAVAGVTALLVSIPGARIGLRIVGACVLVWMGVGMLRSLRANTVTHAEPAGRASFARGFVTNATNPKALLFFAAVIPQFIGDTSGSELRIVALCATVVLVAAVWLSLVLAVVQATGLRRSPAAGRVTSLIGGVCLVFLGGALLLV